MSTPIIRQYQEGMIIMNSGTNGIMAPMASDLNSDINIS